MEYGIKILLVFVIGAMIGSFLNVCIYRMPRNESIVYPSSHCPYCKKAIRWYNNIPILSYIRLLGRCASCGEKISIRYPMVEIITASLLACMYVIFGISTKFFAYSALASALVVVTFIDIDINEIPDSISLGGLVAGLALSVIAPSVLNCDTRVAGFANSLLGALAGGGAIYAMGVFGRVVFRKEAMGGGDVKLMAMIGSFVGWKLALLSFFIAPLLGAGAGIFVKIKQKKDTMAYGPYLSMAALAAIFFGNAILRVLFYGI